MNSTNPNDLPNFGHAVIGFFFWPIGILAYLLLYDTSPQRARSIGTGVALGMMLTFFGAIWLPYAIISGGLRNYRSTSAYISSTSDGSESTMANSETPTPIVPPESSIPTTEETSEMPTTNTAPNDQDELQRRYKSWIEAWQSRNIDSYLNFYAPEATIRDSDGKPYSVNDLKARRNKRWLKERDIKIENLDAPTINIVGDKATLTAERSYHSNISDYAGTKTMNWHRTAGGWLITNEVFKMNSSSNE